MKDELWLPAVVLGLVWLATFGLIRLSVTFRNKDSGQSFLVTPFKVEDE